MLSRALSSILLGVVMALVLMSGVAAARPGESVRPALEGLSSGRAVSSSVVGLTYAYVITANVPVYADPSHQALNLPPSRSLGAGYLWISLADTDPISQDGFLWYHINVNEYVRGDYLAIYEPSAFQGVALPSHPDKPFAWLVFGAQVSAAPGEDPSQGAVWLPRYTPVTIFEEQQVGEWTWYRIGESQWVEQRKVGVVTPSARPEGVQAGDKWIDVNLFEQTLAAYEGDRMVYATLVSTGLPWWKTEPGLFSVWIKVEMAKMSGRVGYPDYYYLEDVPWTMYFNGSFALHTAYWHDRFGFPHSHGCVNLAPRDAKWLFNWTTPVAGQTNWTLANEEDPGTWVWVHDN